MERKFLQDLGLDKEVIDKIMNVNGEDIENAKAGNNGAVEEKDKQIELLNNQLKEVQKTIKGYEKLDIEKIQESNKDLEEKLQQTQKDLQAVKNNTALEKALMETDTVDIETLSKLIDKDSLKYTDDKVEGLEEQIANLKESKSFLFKQEETPKDDRFKPYIPAGEGNSSSETLASEMDSILGL